MMQKTENRQKKRPQATSVNALLGAEKPRKKGDILALLERTRHYNPYKEQGADHNGAPDGRYLMTIDAVTPIFSLEATPEEFARRVRAAREERGWSRTDLARAMGLRSPGTVEAVEKMKGSPSLKTMRAIVQALELESI